MHITFYPVRRDTPLSLSKLGDVLTVNDETFDFSVVPEGATLPEEAISSDWLFGPVERIGGELHIKLVLPHGPDPSHAATFLHPVIVNEDGPIAVPSNDLEEAGE